jgi:uncharacterized membrane protein YfcA
MRTLEFIALPYALSGFGVGFVVGLTGVGGGSLMTPLLVLLFGFHPATAVGTDLLYASVTKTCGTAVHHIGQTVEWRVVGWLGAGSLPASLLTLLLISRQLHSGSNAVASLISYVLGYALLLSALSLLFRRRILGLAHVLSLHRRPRREAAATVLLGALLGALVSLSSAQAQSVSRCSCCSTPTFQSHGLSEPTSHMLFRSPWSQGSVTLRSERLTFLCLLRC